MVCPGVWWVLGLAVPATLGLLVQAETFSSSASVELLVAAQDVLIEHVEAYVKDEEHRLEAIRRSLERIRNETHVQPASPGPGGVRSARKGTSAYAGHPINALHVITRWAEVKEHGAQAQQLWAVTQQRFEDHLGLSLPDHTDVEGSYDGLVRLQETYQLRTDDMARGLIRDSQADQPMSGWDMYNMGKTALKAGYFGLAVEWLEKALGCHDTQGVDVNEAAASLATAYQLIADYSMAVDVLQAAHRREPGNKEIADQLQDVRKLNATMSTSSRPKSVWKRPKAKSTEAYEALCRGEMKKEDRESSRALLCRCRQGRSPITCYKEEILSWDPYIVLYHSAISNKEAKTIKLAGLKGLQRAHVADTDVKEGHGASKKRISQLSWLWDSEDNPVVQRLSARVADITGLRTQAAGGVAYSEPFQVLNYGIGGQYEPHVDFFDSKNIPENLRKRMQSQGDRIATFMFYLNDVEAGGATVFPQLNVRIPPTRNGAAFWYNIKKSGELDSRTEHAGCPVLLGHKWVANKWIHETGQEFHRPCGPHTDSLQD